MPQPLMASVTATALQASAALQANPLALLCVQLGLIVCGVSLAQLGVAKLSGYEQLMVKEVRYFCARRVTLC